MRTIGDALIALGAALISLGCRLAPLDNETTERLARGEARLLAAIRDHQGTD